jgi:hypothetical protein
MSKEMYIAHVGLKPIELKRNGRDNPSCPNCNHYNAMLYERDSAMARGDAFDGYLLKCRYCGQEVQMVRGGDK